MKHRIRASIRKRRESLSPAEAMVKSKRICAQLTGSEGFARANRILFYLPIRNEVHTEPAIRRAWLLGKHLAAPRIESGRLVPRILLPRSLKVGYFGILEPSGTPILPRSQIDMAVVPGIAFDLHGGRVGYGKGYYDAFLKKVPRAVKVAIAYDFQVVPHFRKEPHDIFVDVIITEKRIIDCRKLRGPGC